MSWEDGIIAERWLVMVEWKSGAICYYRFGLRWVGDYRLVIVLFGIFFRYHFMAGC